MKAKKIYDFAVVGAGVIGSAVARDLAATGTVALLDVREDVCEGTSKANTAILHTGFDASPGTLEADLVREGFFLTQDYCEQTGVAVKRCGAVLVAWDEEEEATLASLQEKAVKNGYVASEIIDAEQVYDMLPHLGVGVRGGLTVPDESIIDAWSLPLAFATEAVTRGADLLLEHEVTAVTVREDTTILGTNRGDIEARWVINAAGLGGDILDQRFGYDRIHIHPRKGELFVYDKLSAELVDKIVLAVPSTKGKGVLVSPTVYGNVMLGPTADDGTDRLDTSTTEDGFDFLMQKGAHIFPQLLEEEVTSSYAGLRAAHDLADYLIEVDAAQRYLIAAGIRSTGLTSAMAVSRYVMNMLADQGLELSEREGLPDPPTMPPLGEHQVRPFANEELIDSDPAYGEIICFCERVTRGEIRDAMNSTIPPTTINGLRRRTRAMNGRCQGFFCGAEITVQFKERGM